MCADTCVGMCVDMRECGTSGWIRMRVCMCTCTHASISARVQVCTCACVCIHAVAWRGMAWCGVAWCGVVWCGVVWCGVAWCAHMRGMVWFAWRMVDGARIECPSLRSPQPGANKYVHMSGHTS